VYLLYLVFEVIRNRIDEFGVTEPEIIAQGNDRIVVQLPGVRDIERAKDLIGKTAKLEFKMVNDTIPPQTTMAMIDKATKAGITYKKGERFSEYLLKINEFLKQY
jgi:preprotein translocase subunit SecD